jgi:hypothetical protein
MERKKRNKELDRNLSSLFVNLFNVVIEGKIDIKFEVRKGLLDEKKRDGVPRD